MGYTDTEIATAKMMIRFFNLQTGCAKRVGDVGAPDSNISLTLQAMERVGDIGKLKEHIRTYANGCGDKYKADLRECMLSASGTVGPVAAQNGPVTDAQVNYSMGLLEQAVIGLISKTQAERIESEIMNSVEGTIRDFIKDEYGTIERKINTVIDGKKVPMQGIQHEKFETVLKFVANDEPVFLTGPAGSGKNVICKQVAEALGLPFYFTNAVTQEYKLTGFTDAYGQYQETQFYKAFKNGGVFMLDEMDASIPEVLVILNAAIANRYFDFPAPIGYVEASPDFRVIAAGNTTGHGASYEYVGRNQLDAASLDRFAVVQIDYSMAIENCVACGNEELVTFCREFRRSAAKAGQQVIVSYRAIGRLAKMVQILDTVEALETCLVRGMDRDDVNIILNGIAVDSEYKKALAKLVDRMAA